MFSFSHHVLLYLRTLYIVWSLVRRRVTRRGSKLCIVTFLKIAKHYKTVAVRLRLIFQFIYVQYCICQFYWMRSWSPRYNCSSSLHAHAVAHCSISPNPSCSFVVIGQERRSTWKAQNIHTFRCLYATWFDFFSAGNLLDVNNGWDGGSEVGERTHYNSGNLFYYFFSLFLSFNLCCT